MNCTVHFSVCVYLLKNIIPVEKEKKTNDCIFHGRELIIGYIGTLVLAVM